jgi:choline dehydrogenase
MLIELEATRSPNSGAARGPGRGRENWCPHSHYNGFDQDGIAMTQASISRGRRMSTAKCYLDPARARANLTIETDAMVESLVLEGHRCTGVRYSSRGYSQTAPGR